MADRPNIKTLLESGTSGLKKSKFKRTANTLKWRQKYLGSDTYNIELEDGRMFQLSQVKNGEESGVGTGCSVWPAAHVLSKYLEKHKSDLRLNEKRVCDVGSGTGTVGIMAACLGATVTFTDQLCVFPLLSENVELAVQRCGIPRENIAVKEYNWGEATHHLNPPFDFVIVSDCVLPKLYPIEPLVAAVAAIMGPTTIALFSYEHRPFPEFDPRQEFRRLAHKYSLTVDRVPIEEHDEFYCADDIEIWRVMMEDRDCTMLESKSFLRRRRTELAVLSWGDIAEVQCLIDGALVRIEQEVTGTIGCVLWPSSVAISRFILSCPTGENLYNFLNFGFDGANRIDKHPLTLDIGAGCGLTSISLAARCCDVFAVDKKTVTQLLRSNTTAYLNSNISNTCRGSISVSDVDWYSEMASQDVLRTLCESRPDIIICSDCLYQSTSVAPLKKLINEVSYKDTVVLIANEMRSSFDEFISAMSDLWTIQDVSNALDGDGLPSSSLINYGNDSNLSIDRPISLLICRLK